MQAGGRYEILHGMLAKNPQSWLAQRVTRRGAGAWRYAYTYSWTLFEPTHVPGNGAIARSLVGRRARCSARARVGALQALDRCARVLRREWASFSARALRTKLCMRTS